MIDGIVPNIVNHYTESLDVGGNEGSNVDIARANTTFTTTTLKRPIIKYVGSICMPNRHIYC